jgi:hypothetical protein
VPERRPEVADLIRAGRTAFRPDDSDRERVLQSLAGTLGDGALLGGSHHPSEPGPSATPRFPVRTWVLGGLGTLTIVGVVVAGHAWTARSSLAAPSRTPAILATMAEPSATLPPAWNAEEQATPPPLTAPRSAARSSSAPLPSDSLPEEVRLLSRAEQQLNSGHADEALRTLGEHEQRFPSGALAEERMAGRVQTLCALGRVAEAKAGLAKLARAYPRSAHLDRARVSCGLESP